MANLKNVVYLTEAQYNTLVTQGSITVGGVTYNYDSDNLYLTPKTADVVTELKKEDTSYLSKVSVDAANKITILSDDSPSGYMGSPANSTRVEIAPHTLQCDAFNWYSLGNYNRGLVSVTDGNVLASTNIYDGGYLLYGSCKLGLYARGTDQGTIDDVYAVLGCYGDVSADIKSPNYGFYADNTKVGYYENGIFKNFSSGGSTVSGTHDGTNWTTITINGTQKAIPSGGGGGGGANVVKLPGSAMTYALLEFGGTSYPSYYWEIPSSVPVTSGLVAVVGYSEVAWEAPSMYAVATVDTAGYIGADACAKLKPFIDWQGQIISGKYTVIMPFTEVAPMPASGVCTLIY